MTANERLILGQVWEFLNDFRGEMNSRFDAQDKRLAAQDERLRRLETNEAARAARDAEHKEQKLTRNARIGLLISAIAGIGGFVVSIFKPGA